MTASVWLKATALWLAILVLAVLNGMLREKILFPVFGGAVGFVASGAILSSCVLVVALVAAPWYGPLNSRQWFLVGLFWFLLTVVFEFSFGVFAQHKSVVALLDAYTFRDGNIWPVVLFTALIAPWLAAKIRGLM